MMPRIVAPIGPLIASASTGNTAGATLFTEDQNDDVLLAGVVVNTGAKRLLPLLL
jgi:hypothetical protein